MKQKNSQLDALVDSKKEYMEHLFDILSEPMVATFQEIYQQCLVAPETRKKGILASFQDALVGIAAWNAHLIREHYEKVVTHTGCKYISDLVRALISVQVRINLMANGKEQTLHNVKLKIPSADNFLHRCYVDVARAVWKRPYLLYHNVRAVEKQQNLLDLEKIIQHAIRTVLRGFVPMEQLIAQIVAAEVPSNDSSSSEDESEASSETTSDEKEESSDPIDDTESETDSIYDDEEIVTVVHEEAAASDAQDVDITAADSEGDADEEDADANSADADDEAEESLPQVVVESDVEVDLEEAEAKHDPEPHEAELSVEAEPKHIVEPELDIVQSEPVIEAPVVEDESKKSVELKEELDSDEDPKTDLKLAKMEGADVMPAPVAVPPPAVEAVEKATPFHHMMLMNRRIVRPPSVIMKKAKKKDAFF